MKLEPSERHIIEESFRLNPDVILEKIALLPSKKREIGSFFDKLLLEHSQKPKRPLAQTNLFATTREFWNSGDSKGLTPEERSNLLFKVDDVQFFKFNAESVIQQTISTENEVIKRNMNLDGPQISPIEQAKGKLKPMVAQFTLKNQVIQPTHMNTTGTMCFTEFWSEKQRHNFFTSMDKRVKQVKVPMVNEDQWESVYRPEKIKNAMKVKDRLNQFKSRFGSGEAQIIKPEYKRFSISANKSYGKTSLSERSSDPKPKPEESEYNPRISQENVTKFNRTYSNRLSLDTVPSSSLDQMNELWSLIAGTQDLSREELQSPLTAVRKNKQAKEPMHKTDVGFFKQSKELKPHRPRTRTIQQELSFNSRRLTKTS